MNINYTSSKITGRGVFEENSFCSGASIKGQFYIGAFTFIHKMASVENVTIGRFSRIEKNVEVGCRKSDPSLISNHFFSYAENGPYGNNEAFKNIKSDRYYYEKASQVLVGNDVLIQQSSFVEEGVVIGDGAIIKPASYVDQDVPDYAIVQGNPAKIVGYRFSDELIALLKYKKWWRFDVSLIFNGVNVDYRDVNYFLGKITDDTPLVNYRKQYFNSYSNVKKNLDIHQIVIGPSHVDRLVSRLDVGAREVGEYLLYGLNAMSLYSAQARKIAQYWIKNDVNVLFFVPDFRLGNMIIKGPNFEGARFIDKNLISSKSDLKLKEFSFSYLNALREIRGSGKIRLFFWSLYAREALNRKDNRYICNVTGSYNHPIWNYSEYYNEYRDVAVDISREFGDLSIIDLVEIDGSTHPTDEGYNEMERIMVGK